MKRFSTALKGFTHFLKFLTLPLLVGIYPVLFHFGNNAGILPLSDLMRQVLVMAGISALIYGVCLLMRHGQLVQAALAASIFLIFFHTYGIVFRALVVWDKFQVEQYTLLPLFIILGLYASWIASSGSNKRSQRLWFGAVIILGVLALFNLAKIVPSEIHKTAASNAESIVSTQNTSQLSNENLPDIYYIIFDEMSGFEAMRQYWKYDGVDSFVDFLHAKGFYVAESSHGGSPSTFRELATRLNIQEYPYDPSNNREYWDYEIAAIADNKVTRYLKSLGYTTVVFDEYVPGIPSTIPFNADIFYSVPPEGMLSWGSIFDDFGMLVLNNTMISPFTSLLGDETADPTLLAHRRMIYFTMENASQSSVPSPRFVYVHLLLPHVPFMLDKNGNFIDPKYYHNWDRYLDYYIFTIHVAENMINNILLSANPTTPPVIIIQSDHGARNFQLEPDDIVLQDFPTEYQTLIVNALDLPGCEDAPLTQDMNPINTFPIIFNCYFDANIPLK
jgi:hypothetical protein